MKPLQQFFHMVLFVLNEVQTFESVDEILWCYHSNETSSAVLSHGTICFVYVVLTFESVDETHGLTIQMKPLQQYFHMVQNESCEF